MSLTILDPRTAPIVVGLQRGLRDIPSLHPIAGVIDHSCQLTEAFRKQKLPGVLVNVAGMAPGRTEECRRYRDLPAGFSELISELHPQPDDIVITKRTSGTFATTDLKLN